jgi:hypothetical protein
MCQRSDGIGTASKTDLTLTQSQDTIARGVDKRFATLDGYCLLEVGLAHDIQQNLQSAMAIGYEEDEVLAVADDCIVFLADQTWNETKKDIDGGELSDETMKAAVDVVRDMHRDVAGQIVGKQEVAEMTAQLDVCILFREEAGE